MEQALFQLSKGHPNYIPWVVNYLKMWFHNPVFNGQEMEVGDGEVIRYMAPKSAFHCCFIAESLVTMATKLNATLEFVEWPGHVTKTFLEGAVDYVTNKDADVIDTMSMNRYAAWLSNSNFSEHEILEPTQVFWEMYKIVAVVPKLRVTSGFFKFLALLPLLAWFLLFVSAGVYAGLTLVRERVSNGLNRNRFNELNGLDINGLSGSTQPKIQFKNRFLALLFLYYSYSMGEFSRELECILVFV